MHINRLSVTRWLLIVLIHLIFSAHAEAGYPATQQTTPSHQTQNKIRHICREISHFLRCTVSAVENHRLIRRAPCTTGSPEKALSSDIPGTEPPCYTLQDRHPYTSDQAPPPYTPAPEQFRNDLQSLNPELWTRLGLDNLTTLTCDPLCQKTAQYLVTVDAVRCRLGNQHYLKHSPALDIELQDISGNGFSLSELPIEWLQVDEIVEALQAISDRNKRSSLRAMADALDHARRINSLIYQDFGKVCEVLEQELKTASSLGVDLKVYKEYRQEKDTLNHMLQHNVDSRSLRKCLYYRVCQPEMRHVAECIKSGCPQLRIHLRNILDWVAQQKINTPVVPDGYSGDLLDYALDNKVDGYILGAIVDYPDFSTVSVNNLLRIIASLGDPDWNTGPYQVHNFAKALVSQGHNLAEVETEYGSLVDYAQAHSFSSPPLYHLYELGVPATIEQLVRAIDSCAEALPWDASSATVIAQQLQNQKASLGFWRSDRQENLADYARRAGAPERAIKILAQAVLDDQKREGLTDLPVFQVADAETYLSDVQQFLYSMEYQVISPPKDGLCLYHALSAMFQTNINALQTGLMSFIESLASNFQQDSLTAVQTHIINAIGYDAIQSTYTQILSGEWGELSYLPILASITNTEQNGGIYVMTPGAGVQAFTTTHYSNGQINEVSPENIPDHTPILIHDGSNHWLYAIHQPLAPTPVNNTVTVQEGAPVNLVELQFHLTNLMQSIGQPKME